MDGRQFDEISRQLASASSRRTLLKGALIGLVSGIGGASRARSVDAARAPRQASGAACTRATDCASFSCVDGVCCDTACTGQCESCATGTCQPVVGAPVGNRPACPGAGPCQATCDGVTRTTCAAAPGADVACGAATCADGWLTTYTCGGNGACVPTTTSCAPYGCAADGTSCATGCTSHEQCPDATYCSADGRCVGDQPLGAPCADGAACLHGHCANGVCCNEACDGVCQVCGADGFCSVARDGVGCAGGFCCDGDCVDTASDVEHCGACDYACPADACHDPICTGGVCGLVPARVGEPCDDGNACTVETTCQPDGACRGTPRDCTALDECHEVGVCDPSSGCTNPNKVDNVSCNDGNACTDGDTCQAGVCTSGTPLTCTTDNPCLIASCDPDHGCVYTPKGLGVSCADDNRCDGDEACDGAGNCVAGTPVTCGECTVCDAESGRCLPANDNAFCTPPPSSNLCHTGWMCSGGQCLHNYETVCLSDDECHIAGSCDPATGNCSFVDADDDTPCDVTNKCILDRTCQAGVCSGGFHRDPCGLSLDFCGTGGHCDPWTGACVDRDPVNNGVECTNVIADACTVAQQCQGGVCTNIYEEGSSCSEGVTDACTVEQTCQSGVCTNVQKDCSEAAEPGTCYAGVCDPNTGDCLQVQKTLHAPCDFHIGCGGVATGECDRFGICVRTGFRPLCVTNRDPCFSHHGCRVRDDGSINECVEIYKEIGDGCGANSTCQDDGYGGLGCYCTDPACCDDVDCLAGEACCMGSHGPYCSAGMPHFPCAVPRN